MRISEWIVVGYFAYLSAIALAGFSGASRRARIWGCSAVVTLIVVALARAPETDLVQLARDWLPAAYILAGYYAAGFFIHQPSPSQEEWLQAWDMRLVPWLPKVRLPAAVRGYLELTYSGCFLQLPAGMLVLIFVGQGHLADQYWTLVTASALGAFASLPWFQTRPPWIVENVAYREPTPELALQRVNLFWLRHTSVCMNTFPSGHAAASLAVALAVMPSAPIAGIAFLVFALSIAVASVIGRYHYALDAITGLALACVVGGVVWLAGI